MIKTDEIPAERFKGLATLSTNVVSKRLRILGNCANTQIYEYLQQHINRIFSTIQGQMKETKSKFYFPKDENFKL